MSTLCSSRLRLMVILQTAMPEIEAVSCGAILSNYQRVRVEHVYASTLPTATYADGSLQLCATRIDAHCVPLGTESGGIAG